MSDGDIKVHESRQIGPKVTESHTEAHTHDKRIFFVKYEKEIKNYQTVYATFCNKTNYIGP
jgi:hypothetical protein